MTTATERLIAESIEELEAILEANVPNTQLNIEIQFAPPLEIDSRWWNAVLWSVKLVSDGGWRYIATYSVDRHATCPPVTMGVE